MNYSVRFYKLVVTVLQDEAGEEDWHVHGRLCRDKTYPFMPLEGMYVASQVEGFKEVITNVAYDEDAERVELAVEPHYLSVTETVDDARAKLVEKGWLWDDTYREEPEEQYPIDLQ